ncbi:MAG TPA: HAD family acid phosphatase [Blastocatellia bacterium]|nr:HAD family acid phosphatase [Blastocatellia bacterium]
MTTKQRAGWIVSSLAFLTIGVAVGSSGSLQTFALQSATSTKLAQANPQERTLDADLYMQASAEYAAVCLQTYAWALERLRAKLAVERHSNLQPAVVMDLDETVFDNGGYQALMYREKLSYIEELWSRWERDYPQDVRLVPGAKAFIDAAEQMGIAVVYISNRLTKNQSSTIAAIKHLDLSTENIDARLLLRDQSSDKTSRRQLAAQRYNVLMLVGDNLRDFSEDFVAPRLDANDDAGQQRAIAERLSKVERVKYRFGNDWIILPNPAYGEWQRLIGNNPASKLRTTSMKVSP